MEDMDIKLESERLKKGVELFNKRCDFVLSVASLKQLPPDDKIEVAFAGRSNVGKSSITYLSVTDGYDRIDDRKCMEYHAGTFA